MKLATYNVQARLWTGVESRASAVQRVIGELGADVLALQEVHPPRSLPLKWRDSEGVEYHVVYGPTLTKKRGAFGNALLSRHPIGDVRRTDLSVPEREPRGAIEAWVDLPRARLRVVGTHLGLRAREREAQVARLLERCDDATREPFVLLGDLNEWRPASAALRALAERIGPAPRVRSFPSRWPLFALDRVWTRPSAALVSLVAHRTRLARRASDHLPVVATLALGAGRTRARGAA